MTDIKTPRLFLDSNVLIEALFSYSKDAECIFTLASQGLVSLITCELVIEDIRNVIQRKAIQPIDKGVMLEKLQTVLNEAKVEVGKDPMAEDVKPVYYAYLPIMRHKADIPVLTAALLVNPKVNVILSGNRTHFNDQVAQKCGIPMRSCKEFLSNLDNYIF